MAKNYQCIIDIRTSTVSLTGLLFDNGKFGRCFYKEYRHDGLKGNFFNNPEKLGSNIEKLVADYNERINRDISRAYLILPQRFFRFANGKNVMKIKSGVVNKFDVEEIVNNSIIEVEDCENLESIPIAFKLGEEYIDNPIGQECSELEIIAATEGILARVAEFFTDISKRLNMSFIYVPAFRYALDKLQKDTQLNKSSRLVIAFNDDYIDVCYCEMRAVIAEKTIEIGKSDFISLLADSCGTSNDIAMELIDHINLNLVAGKYAVGGEDVKIFDVKVVNSIFLKLFEHVSGEIRNAIQSLMGDGIFNAYIFGTMVCEVRGAERILSEKIGMPVTSLVPNLLLWDKAIDYGLVGLIESIIRNDGGIKGNGYEWK